MRFTALSLCALFLLAAAGCDYPEAGFYELAGLNSAGKVVFSEPFMIEELVDDTDLTIGFNVLLPREKSLVLVPLENSQDFSRRGWDFKLADRDSGGGDLQLELIHIEDMMQFAGGLRPRDVSQGAAFSGTDVFEVVGSALPDNQEGTGEVSFTKLPREVANGAVSWELRRMSKSRFEGVLGTTVAKAPRREAHYMTPLRSPAPVLIEASESDGPRVRPGRFKRAKPNFGGRNR